MEFVKGTNLSADVDREQVTGTSARRKEALLDLETYRDVLWPACRMEWNRGFALSMNGEQAVPLSASFTVQMGLLDQACNKVRR